MRSLVSFFVLLLATVAQAVSSSGDRLLVVLDDAAEKAAYSKFLGDLEGMPPVLDTVAEPENADWGILT